MKPMSKFVETMYKLLIFSVLLTFTTVFCKILFRNMLIFLKWNFAEPDTLRKGTKICRKVTKGLYDKRFSRYIVYFI